MGTHRRGVWVLDDITPLRQITAATANKTAVLFKPETALRVRCVMNPLQGADVRPTTVQLSAIVKARAEGARVMARWNAVSTTELVALNRMLARPG